MAALYALAGLAGLVALRPIWDVDIFWHIAAGRWIVEHRAFPTKDIFTFVEPARDWVTFQWLYEILCYAVDDASGLLGIRVLHAILTAISFSSFAWFVVRYLTARKVKENVILPVAMLLLALLFALYADRVRARPHVFNLLFWSLALNTLLTARSRLWVRATLLTSVVFLWSNLHAGGSFIFLVVLAAWPVSGFAVARWGGRSRRWAAPADALRDGAVLWGLAVTAALLSPNWLRGVAQAYTMLGGSEALIEEWLPFWHYFAIASNPLHLVAGVMPLVGLGTVVVAMLQGKSVRLEALLCALGLTLLPFRSARFVYFVAFSLVLLVPYLAFLWSALSRRWCIPATMLVSALLLATTMDYHSRVQFGSFSGYVSSFSRDLDERRFPVEFDPLISEMAGSSLAPLKVFCQPNWGGYLLYQHFPKIRVLADGRGNLSEDLGNRLHFIYLYRHDSRYGKAVEKIYTESGADLLVMQSPIGPRGYVLAGWQAIAGSAKGRVLVRK